MNTLAAEIVLALLLLIIGALGGYAYATHNGDVALGTAKSDLAVCTSAAEAKQGVLNDVRQQLDQQRSRLEQILKEGDAAVAAHDLEIAALQREAEQQRALILDLAHDDATCADLARMSICAAVAERLWPSASTSDGHHPP